MYHRYLWGLLESLPMKTSLSDESHHSVRRMDPTAGVHLPAAGTGHERAQVPTPSTRHQTPSTQGHPARPLARSTAGTAMFSAPGPWQQRATSCGRRGNTQGWHSAGRRILSSRSLSYRYIYILIK